MTASDLIYEFLEWLDSQVQAGNYSPKTLYGYRLHLRELEAVLPPGLPAANVKPYHLFKLPATWAYHQAAKRVFHWGARVGYLDASPLRNHDLPERGQRERIFSEEEETRILTCCWSYLRDFLWCLSRTGARPGELRELRWAAVDLDRRVVAIVNFKGKRRRKQKRSARIIALDRQVTDLLTAWRRERSPSPDEFVFTGHHGQPLTKDALSNAFRKAITRAGIDQTVERAVAYTFRHTYGTRVTMLGLSQKIVAELLGHASVTTTERYQHASVSHLVDALDRINDTDDRDRHMRRDLLHSGGLQHAQGN